MKTRILLPAAVVLAIVAMLFAPGLIESDPLKGHIERQIERETGLDARISGRANLALLPYPRIKAEGLTLHDGTGARVARVAVLRGEIRALPLIGGRVDITAWTLSDAEIEVPVDRDGRSPWVGIVGRMAQRADAARNGGAPDGERIGRLVLLSSSLVLRREGTRPVTVTDLDAVLRWPRVSDAVEAQISGRWRGERFEWRSVGPRPVELAAGSASAVTASLTSRALQLGFTGKASSIFDLRAEGAFEASTPDLAMVARVFAHGWGDLVRPVKASIAGQASLTARSIGVANARLQTGAVPLQGALTLRFRADGRPTLAGTLATEALDLKPGLAQLVPARIWEGGWTRQPFAVSVLSEGDVDLRLSASRATLGGHAFEHFASGLMVAGGRLDLTISSGAPGAAGQFRGRLVAQTGASGLETRMQMSGERIDLASFLGEGLALRRLSGQGHLVATLEGRGLNPASLARSLRGQAALTGARGEIIGIDLPAVLRRVERSPLAFAAERLAGRTPFEGLRLEGRVLDGVLRLDHGSVDGGPAQIRITGSVDLAERTLALLGEASAQRAARGGQATAPLPFEVRGSWDDPRVAPDVKALIRRSGAAAPFLEAIAPPAATMAAPSPATVGESRPAP